MSKPPFVIGKFLIRFVMCLFIVFATYNPSGVSWWHWVKDTEGMWPYKTFTIILVVIAYSVILMVARKAFDLLGLILVSGLAASAVWIIFDLELFAPYTDAAVRVIYEVAAAWVMAMGLSYSHIRSQLSGQVTTSA